MVFVRTRVRAERVAKALERGGISAVFIHGAREQAERDRIMARFKTGEERILIATDVSARGIDVPDLDYVINYDLPDNPENYVHRVGRTGRGTRKGQAFSFCSPGEKTLLHQIQALINEEISIQPVSPDEYAQILLDPKDTGGLRQMILIHENEALKKARKKRKNLNGPADFLLEHATGDSVGRGAVRQIIQVARLDDFIHDTSFRNRQVEQVGFIDRR